MMPLSILLLGTIKEAQDFADYYKLPSLLHVKAILFYDGYDYNDKAAQRKIALQIGGGSQEPPMIYNGKDELAKEERFDLIINLRDKEEVWRELNMEQQPFVIRPSALPWFNMAVKELANLEYCRHMLKIITAYATEGIQIADSEGNFIYCNDASYEITGVAREEREGRNAFEVQQDGSISRVLTTKKPVYAHISCPKPGKFIIANASPIYDERHNIVGAVTVYNDAGNADRLASVLEKKKKEIDSLEKRLDKLGSEAYNFEDLIGISEAFQTCVNQARHAAFQQATVLITGESGTGKEMFAHGIHYKGHRSAKPFIKVNCPAIPSTLLESELFGYEKGAFTGAGRSKPGKFELADRGSIFLDEIGDMELTLQSKLLRVLQENEVERLGSNKVEKVDVRVIAATNQDLLDLVAKGLFRKDLYYRLDVIHIHIPPLRERREDIPVLLNHIIKKIALSKSQGQFPRIEPGAMAIISGYDWPGNVREMENVVAKLLIFQNKQTITKEDVLQVLGSKKVSWNEMGGLNLADLERNAIQKALSQYGNSLAGKKKAAVALGISLSSLYDRIKKFGLS